MEQDNQAAAVKPAKRNINQARKITQLATKLLHDEKLKASALKVGVIHVTMEDGMGYSVTINVENTPKP